MESGRVVNFNRGLLNPLFSPTPVKMTRVRVISKNIPVFDTIFDDIFSVEIKNLDSNHLSDAFKPKKLSQPKSHKKILNADSVKIHKKVTKKPVQPTRRLVFYDDTDSEMSQPIKKLKAQQVKKPDVKRKRKVEEAQPPPQPNL